MNTNINKKELEKLSIGLEMLGDRQHEYIKAVGDIAIVLHHNALFEDTLKQPNNPEIANELLSNLIYFLGNLNIKNSRLVQTQIQNLGSEALPKMVNYQDKYEQLLIKNIELQNEILTLNELQNN